MAGTESLSALIENSPVVRRQFEDGTYETYVPYTRYWGDLDHDGTKELLDGWKECWGTCPRCHTLRSASGACEC